ncbi:MAG: hypothetical protein V1778_01525 [bacterium]
MKNRWVFITCGFVSIVTFFGIVTVVDAATIPGSAVQATHAVVQQAKSVFTKTAEVTATGKVYKDNKIGFKITLPTGWKKSTPTDATTIFLATKGTTAVIALNATPYVTQKEANDVQKALTTKPKAFAKAVLAELQSAYTTCTFSSAKKRTIGKRTGAEGVINCTFEGKTYTMSYFSFVRSRTQYTFATGALKSKFPSLKTEYDSIMASISFFTPTSS